MQLTTILDADQLLVSCEETDKGRLLTRMMDLLLKSRLARVNPGLTAETLKAAVLSREAQQATVLGRGMAFPHARIRGFMGLGMVIALMKTPIDFGGGETVSLVCLLVAPENAPMLTLGAMARLAQFFRNEHNHQRLLAAKTAAEAMAFLAASPLALDIPVTVQDIMTPAGFSVPTTLPLRAVSRLMHEKNLGIMPVLDPAGNLVGEITCDSLFQFGLPDFFHQLKSVSFIREFDPFEKYFQEEAHSRAERLMRTDLCRMTPDATLMEAIFALAVKKVTQIYVVTPGGKWLGTVDRDDVLENVLNW